MDGAGKGQESKQRLERRKPPCQSGKRFPPWIWILETNKTNKHVHSPSLWVWHWRW